VHFCYSVALINNAIPSLDSFIEELIHLVEWKMNYREAVRNTVGEQGENN